jgi:uncharacterized protein YfiM (DUF2279 family)
VYRILRLTPGICLFAFSLTGAAAGQTRTSLSTTIVEIGLERPARAEQRTENAVPGTNAQLRAELLFRPGEFSSLTAQLAPVSPLIPETVGRRDSLDHPPNDPWLAFDKAQHLTFGFLWTLGTQYVVVNKGHFSERQALPISIGTSAAVGLAKELYDRHHGPTRFFSFRDLAADAAGILLATGVILLE